MSDPAASAPEAPDHRASLAAVATAVAVLALTAFSLVGKLANQYGFYIYPDSYYYLLIAENLRDHLHPTGTLGPGGMPFPPPGYASMKVTYPLVVAAALLFGVSADRAGHLVGLVAAVATVPVGYWAVRRLIDSRAAGLMAALLCATSYGITYWSGFIMSDSVSVLLAFVALGLLARERPDRYGNLGDLAFGLVVALLMLSRPTYIVAAPLLVWLGSARWGWTRARWLTALALAGFSVSLAAMFWFPPSAFSGRILRNLLPVLGGALGLGLLIAYLARRFGALPSTRLAEKPVARWLVVAAAAIFPLLFMVERALRESTGSSFYLGYARFVFRDPAVLIALVPGVAYLVFRRRWDVATALVGTAVALLGVYFWAEPRESRYVIHVLPFLIPAASGFALMFEREDRLGAAESRGAWIARCASYVLVALLAAGVVLQAQQSSVTAGAPFLKTAYPREVAARLEGQVPEDVTVLTALPWPYYFHLRQPTWGAGVVNADDLTDYVDTDHDVFVLEDASLRFHYGRFARQVRGEHSPAVEFSVPLGYQYGYSAVYDTEPVRGYILSVDELRSLTSTETTTAAQ